MWQKEKEIFISIGRIVGAHGIEGNLKVISDNELIHLFSYEAPIAIENRQKIKEFYTILSVVPYKKGLLISLKGINNRNLAEALVGSTILIEKSKLPVLDEETYYWADIIGLSVYTKEKDYIGTVDSIIPTGSNDVYVVKNSKTEILIPALASVVEEIDLNKKTMRVNLPECL